MKVEYIPIDQQFFYITLVTINFVKVPIFHKSYTDYFAVDCHIITSITC
jgi:hypothetical protein